MELEQLLTSNDFKKTSDPFHVRYKCCFCGELKYKLYVHKKKRVFICHKCGMSGRLKGKISITLDEFQEKVRRFQNGEFLGSEDKGKVELPPEFIETVKRNHTLPYQYLRKRGISDSEIKRYRIGYCPTGRYSERIIIPVYEQDTLAYFVARTYTNQEPRYLNVGQGRNRIIFKSFSEPVREAVITEGIFDAIRVATVHPAIAILGKVMGDLQARKIAQVAQRAIVMLDQDAPKECFQVTCQLNHYLPTRAIFIHKKDPGSMDSEEISTLLKGGNHDGR